MSPNGSTMGPRDEWYGAGAWCDGGGALCGEGGSDGPRTGSGSSVVPAAIVGSVAISMLELFVAFLQAYIFTFLTTLFIAAAIHTEH